MKRVTLTFCIALAASFCFSWMKETPTHPDKFVGKWVNVDYKIDGVTDLDCLFEMDSGTYWFHANGTFAWFRSWYKKSSDTTYTSGTWEYHENKNQVWLRYYDGRKPVKWNAELMSDSVWIFPVGNREITYRKVQ